MRKTSRTTNRQGRSQRRRLICIDLGVNVLQMNIALQIRNIERSTRGLICTEEEFRVFLTRAVGDSRHIKSCTGSISFNTLLQVNDLIGRKLFISHRNGDISLCRNIQSLIDLGLLLFSSTRSEVSRQQSRRSLKSTLCEGYNIGFRADISSRTQRQRAAVRQNNEASLSCTGSSDLSIDRCGSSSTINRQRAGVCGQRAVNRDGTILHIDLVCASGILSKGDVLQRNLGTSTVDREVTRAVLGKNGITRHNNSTRVADRNRTALVKVENTDRRAGLSPGNCQPGSTGIALHRHGISLHRTGNGQSSISCRTNQDTTSR